MKDKAMQYIVYFAALFAVLNVFMAVRNTRIQNKRMQETSKNDTTTFRHGSVPGKNAVWHIDPQAVYQKKK